MNPEHADTEDPSSTTRLDRRRPRTISLRRVVGWGVGGAVGGGVFALIQHLGPGLLREPHLIRWVVLHALLGGVGVALWREATRWATARFALSRHDASLVSGLLAGTLVGAAALFAATLNQGVGNDGLLLLQLPWKDGVGGFVGGAIAGGGWRYIIDP
jgi:hypothetical protein